MAWLFALLRYLFPRDPVRQAAEGVRHCIAMLVHQLGTQEALDALATDTAARAYIEAIINDYEASVRLAIALRACQIAGIRFHCTARPFHQPSRPNSVEQLIRRIEALVALCNDIERLAQALAIKLKRERDADPLAAYGSTDAAPCAAAHYEAVGVIAFLKAQLGLIVRDCEAIVSKDGAVLTGAATGPPVFDVPRHPAPNSEAPLLGTHPLASLQAIPLTPPESRGRNHDLARRRSAGLLPFRLVLPGLADRLLALA